MMRAQTVLLTWLRAMVEAIEAELKALPKDAAAATEAGRVFSASNEQTLRAIVTAVNALLAQVQQAPQVSDQTAPVQPAPPAAAAAVPAAAVVRQSAEPAAAEVVVESSTVGIVTPIKPGVLSEAAVKDGKSLIKVISPGWGSSGFYSAGVLERDAPTAWPAGTKMFWDHAPRDRQDAQPERSLRDLAAETTEDARWMANGPEGPGVYARARVFKAYQEAVDELAPHIGVSIRTSAMIRPGEADGRKGRIVERLVPDQLNSIDFVTVPGRGGKVAALFESYAGRAPEGTTSEGDDTVSDREKELEAALAEAQRTIAVGKATAALRTLAVGEAAKGDLPPIAQQRVVDAVVAATEFDDKGAYDEAKVKAAVESLVKSERAYIDSVRIKGSAPATGRAVTGLGESAGSPTAQEATEAARKDVEQQFLALGMTEGAARIAAAGRR